MSMVNFSSTLFVFILYVQDDMYNGAIILVYVSQL